MSYSRLTIFLAVCLHRNQDLGAFNFYLILLIRVLMLEFSRTFHHHAVNFFSQQFRTSFGFLFRKFSTFHKLLDLYARVSILFIQCKHSHNTRFSFVRIFFSNPLKLFHRWKKLFVLLSTWSRIFLIWCWKHSFDCETAIPIITL